MSLTAMLLIVVATLLISCTSALTCKCMSAGFDPRFSTYLNGEMPTTAPFTGLCTANMTCVAPANSGCFSVRVNSGFYAFCGQSTWAPYVQGVQTVTYAYSPALSQSSSCGNLASQINSVCYCDDRNYCNVPPQLAVMFAGSSGLQTAGLLSFVAIMVVNFIV